MRASEWGAAKALCGIVRASQGHGQGNKSVARASYGRRKGVVRASSGNKESQGRRESIGRGVAKALSDIVRASQGHGQGNKGVARALQGRRKGVVRASQGRRKGIVSQQGIARAS